MVKRKREWISDAPKLLEPDETWKIVWVSSPNKHLQIGHLKIEHGREYYYDTLPISSDQLSEIPGITLTKVNKTEAKPNPTIEQSGRKSGVVWRKTPVRTIVVDEKIFNLRKDQPIRVFSEEQIAYICKKYPGVEKV